MLAAAMEGWDSPHSATDLILMRQYELTQAAAGAKKPQPYPTAPWAKPEKTRQHFGNVGGRTRTEVIELLNGMGHSLPV